jgi:hypothetical protein
MRWVQKPSPALVIAIVALGAAVGGFAVAAVPDSKGRITACYVKKNGNVRLLVKGSKCKSGETLIRWNQTGPAGLNGAAGAPGGQGVPGQPGEKGLQGVKGSSASSMLTGNTGNIPVPVDGNPRWLHPSGVSDVWGATTFAEMLSPNTPLVARDLAVQLGNPAGAGESYKVTLQIGGVDSALTCTVAGDTDTTCGNSADSVAIAPKSRLSFELEVSTGAVSRRVLFGWRATEPD